jgi:uncharacterized membrane protein YdfJ with MMPL/SSD domain
LIERFAAAVSGPRGRWVAIAVWALIGVAGILGRAQINDVTAAGQSSFLPKDAESTRALAALQQSQKSGEEVPVVIVPARRAHLVALANCIKFPGSWPGNLMQFASGLSSRG